VLTPFNIVHFNKVETAFNIIMEDLGIDEEIMLK
jgi:hypothetical protein